MRGRGLIVAALLGIAAAPSCSGGGGGGASGGDAGASSGSGSSGGDASGSGSGSSGSGSGSSTGSGGSSGGSGSGSGGSGSGSGSGSGGGDAGSCLGSSFLAGLGKKNLVVGGSMAAATAKQAPFDLQYQYVSGGFSDGAGPCASCATGCTTKGKSCANAAGGCNWWGCWQYDQDPPGAYVRSFVSSCAQETPPQIAMITYYEILQASGVTEGAPEVTQAATNATFMAKYFADWRFLLQQIGASVALLHIEPDFWGYAEQKSEDPTSLPAAVASANPTDCKAMPNTIAGMGQCLVAMVRTYAPKALVGLHASAWGTNVDAASNTDPSLDVAAVAQKTAKFLAACGESQADYVIVETSDRDAGYYQSVGRNTWWDAGNAKLPDFHQDFAYVKALTEALGKPALYWQVPLGNMSLNNTTNHWQDNRVDYFFGHWSELAAAHAVGAAFGAGASDQTTPESDGGNFVAKAKAYYAAGGQPLCQ